MTHTFNHARTLAPDYPVTIHLETTIQRGSSTLLVTEKLDGANSGVFLENGEIRVRNRTHVLSKGYLKDTPAKAQFRLLFGWAHAHKRALLELEKQMGAASMCLWRVAVGRPWRALPAAAKPLRGFCLMGQ
jgi:hypothetical protein